MMILNRQFVLINDWRKRVKVLLFCCKGFETIEFAPFVDVMGWARNDYGMGIEVITAGFSKTVISAFGC